MFKSIEYNLLIFLLLLITVTSAAVYCLMSGYIFIACFFILTGILLIRFLLGFYKRFNKNIVFLLNAINNGDYSFRFAENKISKNEREINATLNRIKEILSSARKEVIENEKFLQLIVESLSAGIIVADERGGIISANEAARSLLNMPVLTHIKQLQKIDAHLPELFRSLETGDRRQISVANERGDVQLSLRASYIERSSSKGEKIKIITLNNIGNELEAKEMESWVRLIRVMTHEIMNSIAPITSLSDMLISSLSLRRNEVDNLTDTVEALETISTTAKGLLEFVQSYRRFTGIKKPEIKTVEARKLVESVARLEAEQIKAKGITLEIVDKSVDTLLQADAGQITQVLINLIKNAIEAIEIGSNGIIRITIDTGKTGTQITVANNGTPIPKDDLPNIFVPFFTTKTNGSGIGLSVSRYIMRLHSGNLKHHFAKGFTSFTMEF
jgi:nitrogen fixation/metabolism regulation signal transduction histidine kinase